MKTALIQAAWSASSKKDCYWYTKYRRLRSKLGTKKAIVAIARKMLVTCYYVLKNRSPYKELGVDYVDKKANERKRRYHMKQLKRLGFNITLAQKTV